MLRKALLLTCAAAVVASAWAQGEAVVGSTVQVRGLVTVSSGTTVSTVTNNSPVLDGSRYVTSSNGHATLRYSDGCTVVLEPNQVVEINSRLDCGARIALIQGVGDGTAVALLSGELSPALLGLAVLAGAGAVQAQGRGAGGGTPVPPGPFGTVFPPGIPNPPPSTQ